MLKNNGKLYILYIFFIYYIFKMYIHTLIKLLNRELSELFTDFLSCYATIFDGIS